MADKKKDKKTREEFLEEKIPFVVRRPQGVEEDFTTVTVNGKNYQITYGKTVMIPRFIAEVIENSYKASDDAASKRREFEGLFNSKASELS